MKILVYPNSGKIESALLLKRVVDFAEKNNVTILLSSQVAKTFNYPELAWDERDYSQISVALSIGGDGTLLSLIRKCAKHNIPVCGINIGHLGFLADIEVENLEDCLEKLISGAYYIKERLMLTAKIIKDDKEVTVSDGVNDIVIARPGVARILHLEVYINDYKIASYPADGMIVSTPTGSTAYSLSAGGPIVSPLANALVVTPICPHLSSIRPLVIGHDEVVTLRFAKEKILPNGSIKLTVDGQEHIDLNTKDRIVISKSQNTAKIIRFEKSKFYQTLQSKLSIG